MDIERILIVDDEEVNRTILEVMFRSRYHVVEAANGQEAIDKLEEDPEFVLVFLDVVMPVMAGFDVLEYMKQKGLTECVPVILITSETTRDSEERAYAYGIADVIHKPFYPDIVKRRAQNIIDLYQHKSNMEKCLKEQEEAILAKEKKIQENNEFLIGALSSVVEFRSSGMGEHIRRIKYFTRILLNYLDKCFPQYGITQTQINEIARASALHDIGKIGIPEAILRKPGKLTTEEFETMKTHTIIGCDILKKFKKDEAEEFYRYCYDICRYHHERWDGNGYPDHLVGEEIPIWAQVVSIVDVYDALTSERVYKPAFSHAAAYKMIQDGECGQFSPDILECFKLAKEDFSDMQNVTNSSKI